MTSSLYVTGTHVASVEGDPFADGRTTNRVIDLTHAVAKPAIDGLEGSVCGVLVTAIPHLDWQMVWGVPRCPRCQQAVGC